MNMKNGRNGRLVFAVILKGCPFQRSPFFLYLFSLRPVPEMRFVAAIRFL